MSKFLDETGLAYFWNKIQAALSTVAFSGSYNDLTNKPSIPASITVDTALSSTSENPVQNKVINIALGTKANDSDVVKLSGNQTVAGTKTFSSALKFNVQDFAFRSSDSSYLSFQGGSADGNGAIIRAYGKDHTNSGWFFFRAKNASQSTDMIGKPDGTLTWGGKAIAIDENVVHLTGDETVGGNKTFSSRITLNGPMSGRGIDYVANTLVKGNTPSSDQSMSLCFFDKNGYSSSQNNYFGFVGIQQLTTNIVLNRLVAYQNVAGSTTSATVGAGIDANGVSFAYASSTSSSRTDGNDIVTRNWIPNDTRIVHTSGDETISGVKTFTDDINCTSGAAFKEYHTSYVSGNSYSSNIYLASKYLDKNGSTLSDILYFLNTPANNGDACLEFRVNGNPNHSSSVVATLGVHSTASGDTYAHCPTPSSATDNSTKIATTAWIRTATGNTTLSASNVTGTVAIANGGTGKTSFANSNGVLTVDNTNNRFTAVATASGALYATSANGVAQFGTLPFAQGGTGATSRLGALKALTNESVSTNATHFLTITTNWAKGGYTSVADVKTVLGLGSAAYTASSDYAASSHTHEYLPLSGGNLTGSIKFNTTSTVGIYKGNATSLAEFSGGSAINKGARLGLYGESHSSNAGRFDLIAGNASTSKSLIGKPDGTLTWGGQSVSTSSDERIKTKLQQVPEDILNAWGDVEWGEFKFLEAVADKGENARLHTGLIAQAVDRVFKAKDLDACKYGILCHEEREATEEEPAVDLWTVRYTEALCMEAAYQRHRADKAEARITALEEEIAKIKSLLEVK